MQWIFWIIAILLSAGAGYWVYKTDRLRAIPYPWVTALLRSMVVFLTLLLLLLPVINTTRNHTEKPVVLLLQDNSSSIGAALAADSVNYRKNTEALLSKLSNEYKVVRWAFGDALQTDSFYNYHQPATDISSALTRAEDFFGAQNLGAVILATDGRFNQGANPAYQQLAFRGALYTVAIGDSATQKDIAITQTYANKTVALNSQFEVRADLVASLCNGYSNSVQLTEGGSIIGTAPVEITANKYDRSVSFTIKATKAGLHHYVLNVPMAVGEKNTDNNRRDVFVEVVDDKKNILIITAAPHPDVSAIKDALSTVESYKVTVRNADNLPASLADYQAIVLHGLPNTSPTVTKLLQGANKPVWYILGEQTDVHTLSSLVRMVTIQGNTAALHDVLPAVNSAFGLFTLPQNINAVVDKMPPLVAPSGSMQAAPDATMLMSQKDAASQPLWVLQQGTVPAAMLLGSGLWRWRVYEYKNFGTHDVIDECIRQTVAFLCANSQTRPFQITLPKYIWSDQEAVSLNGYLLNANNQQTNTPDAHFTLTDSGGRKHEYAFERSGNAYKLNIGVWAGGSYTYDAQVAYGGKTYHAAGSFVVAHMPLEQMQTGADYPLLYNLAKKYNGALVPAADVSALYDSITHNQQIKPVIDTTTETAPLVDWKWYFFLILAIATAEWLLRKYWMAQ